MAHLKNVDTENTHHRAYCCKLGLHFDWLGFISFTTYFLIGKLQNQ